MRIALITPGISPYVMGGMQRHSFNLAKHLARLRVEIDLYHTDFGDSIGIDGLLGMDPEETKMITSISVPWVKGDRWPGHYIRESRLFSEAILRKMLQRSLPDFIYAQGLTGLAIIENKKNGVSLPPVGVNVHGYEMYQQAANLKNKLEHWLLRPTFRKLNQSADHVFSFSGKIREIVELKIGVPSSRVIEIPNGIDQSWLLAEVKKSSLLRRFVFVGRYERRKGIEELCGALSRFSDPGFEFHFVGPIPPEKQINKRWIKYWGSVREETKLMSILDQSDVIVCPSYSEGMPTVILEGMARGLAVIATDVGAVQQLVSKENGILLSRTNIKQLAIAIQALDGLSDIALEGLKKKSLEKVREFSWDQIARMTINKIGKLLDY